jgi:hypothetical protein
MSTEMAVLAVECDVHFRPQERGRKELRDGPGPRTAVPEGRIPRVARLMALAIRFDCLVRSRTVRDHAELARLGHVTRARISQIMSLINLSPAIQEDLLFLPPVMHGHDPVVLREILPIAARPEWHRQHRMWAALRADR